MKSLIALLITISLWGCASPGQRPENIFTKNPSFARKEALGQTRKPTNTEAPSDQVFDQILQHADSKNYLGYDVVACYDQGKMKIGGVYHWGAGYTLFMDSAGGRMEMGTFKRDEDGGSNPVVYKSTGLTLKLTSKGFKGNIQDFEMTVENSFGGGSEVLNCFQRNSGLE